MHMVMMMILLLNRYGHKPPFVSKFLVIVFRVFRCSCLFWILLFIVVTSVWCFFTLSFVVWIRLEDPTMLLFFPSARMVGFLFSLPSSSFESYPFLFSSALIHSLESDTYIPDPYVISTGPLQIELVFGFIFSRV